MDWDFTRQPHEAQVDGHAALLLFPEPVGVDAGERLHQCGLAVVDVPGGAYDVQRAAPCVRWRQNITAGRG